MLNLTKIWEHRESTIVSIQCLTEEMTELYEKYPGLFSKRPEDMSIADKLRFSGELLKFIEAIKTKTK